MVMIARGEVPSRRKGTTSTAGGDRRCHGHDVSGVKLAMKFHELDIDDELLPGQGGAEDTEERVLAA